MTTAVRQDLLLAGCRDTPLASYLSGIGVLRLVAEQVDPAARGSWSAVGFLLHTRLSQSELDDFFLDDYRPSPVVSPWNSGSGFDKGSKGPDALRRMRDSTLPRLAGYAETIRVAERVLAAPDAGGLTKAQLVQRCRGALPDEAVPWLDAAVVLGGDRGVEYPPLLGTGGNDGRLDFSVAFLGRLAEVLGLLVGRTAPSRERSRSWLRAALLAEPSQPMPRETSGQFSPGSLGGVGAGPGAEDARTNPWQFVLLIEGALVFAAAAARRLGAAAAGRAVMPFTFDVTPAGYASNAEEDARAELWMPIWDRPASFAEVARLLSEGRVSWRGRQARTGLDAARAATTLGVDRGLAAFQRYGLLTRNGLSTLAVPLARVQVTERSVPAVRLAGALDGWVSRIAAARNAPAAVTAALRRMTAAQLTLAQSPSGGATGRSLLAVLLAAADLEQVLGRSSGFRSASGLRPVPALSAAEWLPLLDQPAELWLATAFASLRDRPPRGADAEAVDAVATLVRPVVRRGRGLAFAEVAPIAAAQSHSIAGLAALAVRREVLRAARPASAGLADIAQVGSSAWFDLGLPLRLADAQALLDGALDEARLVQLVQALSLLDFPADGRVPPAPNLAVSVELALLLPFQIGAVLTRQGDGAVGAGLGLRPGRGWARRLLAGNIDGVLREAAGRLRVAGVDTPGLPAEVPGDPIRGARLAALTVARVDRWTASRLLGQLDPPEPQPAAEARLATPSPTDNEENE